MVFRVPNNCSLFTCIGRYLDLNAVIPTGANNFHRDTTNGEKVFRETACNGLNFTLTVKREPNHAARFSILSVGRYLDFDTVIPSSATKMKPLPLLYF